MNKFQRKRIERLKTKYVHFDLLNSVNTFFSDSKKQYLIKTKNRSSTILPCFVNLTVYVYNGKKYLPFYVIKDYLGH
jgi:small subunit ribosomal protein S19